MKKMVYTKEIDDEIISHEKNVLALYLERLEDYRPLFEEHGYSLKVNLCWLYFPKSAVMLQRGSFKNGYSCYVACAVQKYGKDVDIPSTDGEVDYYTLSAAWGVSSICRNFFKLTVSLWDDIDDDLDDDLNDFLSRLGIQNKFRELILYSDAHTKMLETNGQWVSCIEYLRDKWKENNENISLFLKLAVNTWYTVTLDGQELSLKKEEADTLKQVLRETYSIFRTSFSHDQNCQWLFGYMMTAQTVLFLDSGSEYTAIEQQGEALIEKAGKSGNLFARLLCVKENSSKKTRKYYREKVREHIPEYFDENQEVDKYFIEMFGKVLADRKR